MRLRAILAAAVLLLIAALSVRETRCGSECQAAAALFAANSASIQKATADPMPGMENCPMAKIAADTTGDTISSPSTCQSRMVHSPDDAKTEEHTSAPEFQLAPITLASLTTVSASDASSQRDNNASPPGRSVLQVSLQTTLRI